MSSEIRKLLLHDFDCHKPFHLIHMIPNAGTFFNWSSLSRKQEQVLMSTTQFKWKWCSRGHHMRSFNHTIDHLSSNGMVNFNICSSVETLISNISINIESLIIWWSWHWSYIMGHNLWPILFIWWTSVVLRFVLFKTAKTSTCLTMIA